MNFAKTKPSLDKTFVILIKFLSLQKNYDEEFDAFRRHTERVLCLCPICEVKVQEVIKGQDEELMRRRSHLEDSHSFMQDEQTEQTYLVSMIFMIYLTHNLLNFIKEFVHLPFLELSIIKFLEVHNFKLASQQCRAWSDCTDVLDGLA